MISYRNSVAALRSLWRTRTASRRAEQAQRPASALRFAARAKRRCLLVSLPDPISQSQIHPFHHFAGQLADQPGVDVLEIGLDAHLQQPELAPTGADVVCFQTWIHKTAAELQAIVAALRQRNPDAKIVFLDPFAPTDLRYASALDPVVDLYVKKHVLRDRAAYQMPTEGDTNLSHWYGRHYGLTQPQVHFEVPTSFLAKLIVGPSFVTAPYLLPDFERGRFPGDAPRRPLELHARLGGAGQGSWYELMRTDSLAAVAALHDVKVSATGRVGRYAYLAELASSQMCFSPFGYGEVCWRDFEAVHAGALLLKPDMDHVETDPNVFRPHDTYVPLAWDFSDLGEKVRFYRDRPGERERICRNAFELLQRYAQQGLFVPQMARVLAS